MKVYQGESEERINIRFGCGESFWKEDEDMFDKFDELGKCDGEGEGLCNKCKKKLEEYDVSHTKDNKVGLNKGGNKSFGEIPVKKGDIVKLGAISIGANGDFMFQKDKYRLFLKNPKNKPVVLGEMIELKVVKIFPKVGYVELI